MIEADEHLHRPRGRLVYHIELVGLLGACALGRNAAAEMMVRDLLPLDELIRQITMPGLPMQLRANYLCVLREAYLETERANKEVGAHPALMGFLSSLRASIEDLVEALVEPGSNILEEEAQLQAASYVCWEVLPTSTLNPNPNLTLSLTVALTRCCRRCSSCYYRSHYSLHRPTISMYLPTSPQVLPTLQLYYRSHYSPPGTKGESRAATHPKP